MSFVARVIVLELLLVSVLTWMLERSFTPPPTDMGIERAIDRLDSAESALDGHVLALRSGLALDYDPLVADLASMREQAAGLMAGGGETARHAGRVLQTIEQREDVIERFKSDNAVVQNALATFDHLTQRLTIGHVDPNLALAAGAVAGSIAHLARAPNAGGAEGARLWLDTLARLHAPEESAADVASFGLHGRTLIRLLPRLDELTRRQAGFTIKDELISLREDMEESHQYRQHVSDLFRLALYAIAVIISILLLRAGFNLRDRTLALQHRIEIDAASVKVSSLPAADLPGQIEDQLDLMLALMGRAAGADRAYILTSETPRMERIWCAAGVPLPVGWPDSYGARLPSYFTIAARSFRMRAGDPSLPPGLAESLRSEGMLALSCAKLLQDGSMVGVLCFERSKPFPPWLETDDVVLDVIGDIVAGALQRRDAARRRRELEVKLRRAERLWSIGMFTSGIAHNFNNLLAVIGGQAEMAAGVVEAGSPAARHVEQIAEAVRRGRTIVGDILDYGRSEPKMPHSVDLPALLKESVANLEALREGGRLHLRLQADAVGARVLADAGQLHQVLLNVIQNAMQASAAGGGIEVGLDLLASASRRLSHGSLKAGQFVRVSVSDSGRGMDPAQQARMFQPFFTTREGGTGLGLATAFQTVAEIGGAFDVTSALGTGTTVEIWLPACDNRRREKSGGGTVLLLGCDREEMLRDEDLLAALGFEPVGFTDLDAALAAIRVDARRFDIVLIDQVVVEGHAAVVQRLHGLTGIDKPVVLSFSECDAEAPPLIPVDGVAAILRRPWRPAAVLAALNEVLPG